MQSTESQKRKIIDELNDLLDQGRAPLSSIVRKAARLANLCGEHEYRLLFDVHLDGFNPDGTSGTRVPKWPDPKLEPNWDITDAFYKDRAVDRKSLGIPLEQIEFRLEQIPKEKERLLAKGNAEAANLLTKAQFEFSEILTRIGNRVTYFVRYIENAQTNEGLGAKAEAETLRMRSKYCPRCNRAYMDEQMSYCLEDGTPLIFASHDAQAETLKPAS